MAADDDDDMTWLEDVQDPRSDEEIGKQGPEAAGVPVGGEVVP